MMMFEKIIVKQTTTTKADPFLSTFRFGVSFSFFFTTPFCFGRFGWKTLNGGKFEQKGNCSMKCCFVSHAHTCMSALQKSLFCKLLLLRTMRYKISKKETPMIRKNASLHTLFCVRFHVGGIECFGEKVNETSAESRNPKFVNRTS